MKKKEIKIVLKKLKKTLGLKTLLILIVLLSFNTYAWFVFSSHVDTEMGAKVRAWNITFTQDDQSIMQSLTFDIDDIYPGMNNYHDEVIMTNNGDTNALVSFEINSVRILDTTYTVSETLTSDDIINMLENDFPFKIQIGVNHDIIAPSASSIFAVEVIWNFEENEDSVDTLWGENAYTYNHTHTDMPSISINLTIHIDQTN